MGLMSQSLENPGIFSNTLETFGRMNRIIVDFIGFIYRYVDENDFIF
jgi:hypothetical protein